MFDEKLNQCVPKCDLECGSGECLIKFDFMGSPEKVCKCGDFEFFEEKYRTCLPRSEDATSCEPDVTTDASLIAKLSYSKKAPKTMQEASTTKVTYKPSTSTSTTTTVTTTTTTTVAMPPTTSLTTTVTTTATTTAITTTTTVTMTSTPTKSFEIIPATTEPYLSQKIVLQEGNRL